MGSLSLLSLVALQLSPWRALSGVDEPEFIRAMPCPSPGWFRQGHTLEVESETEGRYTAPGTGMGLPSGEQMAKKEECLLPLPVPRADVLLGTSAATLGPRGDAWGRA